MKRIMAIGAVAAMVFMAFVVTPQRASASPDNVTYPNRTLSGGYQTGHFDDMWDLTASDMTVSFTYDANDLVDDFGGAIAHAWAELGVRTIRYGDFNPTAGSGVWLATDYEWSANTFDPDPLGAPTLDLDDKLILQKVGGQAEGAYNLPSTPPAPGNNHRVWWDRDGVDPYQNPATANTGGIYQVVMKLHATGDATGTAYLNIRGLDQGFETDGNWNTIELTPAGMTFSGDMKRLQIFYGLSGYGATHSVEFRDIVVIGTIVPPWGSCLVSVDDVNKVITLLADCTTDRTIWIPDGWTLDGGWTAVVDGVTTMGRYSITAIDPTTGHFLGAVVQNMGQTAHVRNLEVESLNLANVCDPTSPVDTRLRGIMFNGASGSIFNSVVSNINQGPSGCQEGNAIEIRNAPFDGNHPSTKYVEVSETTILDYQKTGIVANGDVYVNIHHNTIGASATQLYLAPNSVQFGSGGMGSLTHNLIYGNQWLGPSSWAGTAILLVSSGIVDVNDNNIRGNSDVGIYVAADNCIVNNNRVYDEGPDGPNGDFGIANMGDGNTITANKVRGFVYPYYGPTGGKNKIVSGPNAGGGF